MRAGADILQETVFPRVASRDLRPCADWARLTLAGDHRKPASAASASKRAPVRTLPTLRSSPGPESEIAGGKERKGRCRFRSAPFRTSRQTDIDLAPLSRAEFLRYKLPEPMVLALQWSSISFRFCGTELILRLVSSSEALS